MKLVSKQGILKKTNVSRNQFWFKKHTLIIDMWSHIYLYF